MGPPGEKFRLTPRQQGALNFIGVLAVLPHAFHFPLTINLYLLLLSLWCWMALRWSQFKPGRWLRLLSTISGVALIYSHFHTLIGYESGVPLLTVMLLLKVLETQQRRDLIITIFISYFVIITHFLYNQSILLALYLLGVMIASSALLMEINRVKASNTIFDPLLRAATITLQAMPIALIIFVIFPRISQPLWHLSRETTGVTGLSDRITPGNISRLAESKEIAFRINFKRTPPKPEARYWRGLVIWDSDGVSWYNQPSQRFIKHRRGVHNDTEVNHIYQVFLEAHNKPWLYSLDLPLSSPSGAVLTEDRQLLTKKPISQPLSYQVLSSTQQRDRYLPKNLRQRALSLPKNVTQRQRDLVNKWRTINNSPAQVVQLALKHFNQQPFVYTLTPPRYHYNPIDQFLFEGKEGFCEHYATAFTQLMRLADIPTRLVVGYQGGEFNPVGNYFIVRQSDAHAWTEVWLEQQGWVRIDPTAAVAPQRIRFSIQNDLRQPGSPVNFHINASSFLRQFNHVLDSVNVQWRLWVIGYSLEHQSSLMRRFGFDAFSHLEWGLLTMGMITIPLILLGLRLRLSGRMRPPRVVAAYRLFCRRLARLGIPRHPYEGPKDYAQRARTARPDLATPISRVTALYISLHYGPHPNKRDIHKLYQQVRQFRPKRRRLRI
jgi:transglutaminase-like putative cysteine protease